MALFRPYERTEKPVADRISELTPKGEKSAAKAAAKAASKKQVSAAPQASAAEPTIEKIKVVRKKDAATPSRRQAEAARMERLHPSLSPKEQRRVDREARSKSRVDQWDRVENSPERQLVRDYVDTRWTVAEFMLPAMILVMAATMATMNNIVLSSYIAVSLWVLLAITIINVAVMWFGFKKLLAERHPGSPTRGLLVYMFNRSLMIRRFRRPAPRINRGEPI